MPVCTPSYHSVTQKEMAFMLGRHGMFLELNEDVEDYEDLTEIMSNVQLNSNFLALAREVREAARKKRSELGLRPSWRSVGDGCGFCAGIYCRPMNKLRMDKIRVEVDWRLLSNCWKVVTHFREQLVLRLRMGLGTTKKETDDT